jgi:NADH-quinone oxidoreductase subunit K
MTQPDDYLVVGAVLFALGAVGFLTRRNLILMMLSAELMLHGVSLNLVSFSASHGNHQGQAFTAFVLTVAACEAGIALALILALFRRRKTLDINVWSGLGEPVPGPKAEEPLAPAPIEAPVEPAFPHLTPAGRAPVELVDRIELRKETVGRV